MKRIDAKQAVTITRTMFPDAHKVLVYAENATEAIPYGGGPPQTQTLPARIQVEMIQYRPSHARMNQPQVSGVSLRLCLIALAQQSIFTLPEGARDAVLKECEHDAGVPVAATVSAWADPEYFDDLDDDGEYLDDEDFS